jgi:small-conductance mechanosensitive channel
MDPKSIKEIVMQEIREFVENLFQNNPPQVWLTALVTILITILVLALIRNRLGAKLKVLALRTQNTLDDAVVEAVLKTKWFFIVYVAIWFGSRWLELSSSVSEFLNGALVALLIIQAAVWGTIIIGELVRHFVRLQVEGESTQIATTTALTFVGKLVLWSMALLLLLENMNFDVSALVASLGVGGIAVALAAQNILGDLFASLSILFDKPFVVGDFIIVDTMMGSVEKVGLKTTRVRSLSGEQLIFSNNDLLSSRIKNYKRMEERRVVFTLGVTYQTKAEKMEMIPAIVREAIEKEEKARFDRSHFKGYGDFALLFETVYWVTDPDYTLYMDIQQKINFELFQRFEEEGIEFAYPTQTIHLAGGQRTSQAGISS